MMYLFQRIIRNDFGWERPSPGRTGYMAESAYVDQNGFGHEDWNFNKDYSINGFLYGYTHYKPSEEKRKYKFNIAFARYINGKWHLIGFYLKALYVKKVPIDNKIILNKMKDIRMLNDSLGYKWRHFKRSEFIEVLKEEAQWSKWRVHLKNAIRLPERIEIPKSLFDYTNYQISRPKSINPWTFNDLLKLAKIK